MNEEPTEERERRTEKVPSFRGYPVHFAFTFALMCMYSNVGHDRSVVQLIQILIKITLVICNLIIICRSVCQVYIYITLTLVNTYVNMYFYYGLQYVSLISNLR